MLSIRSRLKVFRLLVNSFKTLILNGMHGWQPASGFLHKGGGGKKLGEDSWHPFSKGGANAPAPF